MTKRHSGCPLCGGQLTVSELLDACDGIADADLGVLSARCPHCQGLLEIRPAAGRIEIGYTAGNGSSRRFDIAFSLACAGLEIVAGADSDSLQLRSLAQSWTFVEA